MTGWYFRLRPEQCQRPGKRKLLWIAAKTLSHRIHPDVPGNVFHVVGSTQNVIVVFALPEAASFVMIVVISDFARDAALKGGATKTGQRPLIVEGGFLFVAVD